METSSNRDYDSEVYSLLKQFEPHNLLTEGCSPSLTDNNNQPIVVLKWVDNTIELEEDSNANS